MASVASVTFETYEEASATSVAFVALMAFDKDCIEVVFAVEVVDGVAVER